MNETEVPDTTASSGLPMRSLSPGRYRDSPYTRNVSQITHRRGQAVRTGTCQDSTEPLESNDDRSKSRGEPQDAEQTDRLPTGGDALGCRAPSRETWASHKDILDARPERQVLVVGDDIVGRTLTAFLQCKGYEPVLATGAERPTVSTLVHLGPVALDYLEQLGLADRVRDQGTRIESLVVSRPPESKSWTIAVASSGGTSRLDCLIVEAAAVRRTLAAQSQLQGVRTDRTIARVVNGADSIGVEFVDGVREWFDVIVDTVGTPALQRTDHDAASAYTLYQYQRRFDLDDPSSNELRDVWLPDGLVQFLPCTDSPKTLLRVTACHDDASKLLDYDGFNDEFAIDATVVSDGLRDMQPVPVRQTRITDDRLSLGEWGGDRVVRCGTGACPVAPATGFGVSFGLRDAVAFVEELARREQSIATAVHAFATGRERTYAKAHLKSKTSHVEGLPSSTPATAELRTVDAFRKIALEPLVDSGVPGR